MLAELKLQLTKATFDTWVKATTARKVDGHWEVTCANEYAKDRLEHRLAATIRRTLAVVLGEPVAELTFRVRGDGHGRSARAFGELGGLAYNGDDSIRA